MQSLSNRPPATNSYIQYGVTLLGIAYLGMGLIGFLPINAINPYHPEGIGARYLFRFITIDSLHNVIHIAIGLSGLWAARELETARLWGKVMGAVLIFLFVDGMAEAFSEGFPKDQRLLGLVALNSAGHALHLGTGTVALILGFTRPTIPSQTVSPK